MLPRLRQLVLAASSLAVADTLAAVLCLGEPFEDPDVAEFGLVNRVFALGDQFLEVVTPVSASAPAARFLARGSGGYMAIFEVADIAEARRRVDSLGIRRVWNIDLPDISASHLHPADCGAAIVSLDQARPAGSWRWAGPGWAARRAAGEITGARLQSPEPDAVAGRWARLLGVPLDGRTVACHREVIRVDEGAAARLSAFDLRLPDAPAAFARARAAGLTVTGNSFFIAGVEVVLAP